MRFLDWFRSKRTLVRRVSELEKGIYDIGVELAEKRIMFMHRLSPDYVQFLAGIITSLGDLLGEKEVEG